MDAKVIGIINHKGGCGKTTTAVNLCGMIAEWPVGNKPRKVLLIDMDPQGSATSWLGADEIEYNEESREAVARGNVHFRSFKTGEELWGDKVEYNVREETGRFYNIRGTSLPRIEPRPRLLTTTNPFQFQGRWAERLKDRYILYDGLITNCRIPKPWWTLSGPKFDIIPGDRALAYRSVFRVKRVPIFYAPFFFKSLESEPRKSGFLTPNLGNSSRRGKMIGADGGIAEGDDHRRRRAGPGSPATNRGNPGLGPVALHAVLKNNDIKLEAAAPRLKIDATGLVADETPYLFSGELHIRNSDLALLEFKANEGGGGRNGIAVEMIFKGLTGRM